MKRLKNNTLITLSFVKLSSFVNNSFDITLEKVVGNETLSLTSLTDSGNLAPCKDFISISIDLVSVGNVLNDGGEYILTLSNDGNSYTYLTIVEDYQEVQGSGGIYADTVRFTDL